MISRIRACVVTSSAVVGSSATKSAGSSANAIAIITRWRCPPESWCGYVFTRRSGSGSCTERNSSITRSRRSEGFRTPCVSNTSRTCSPTVRTGLRAVIGSWKIIAMARPRSERSRAGGAVRRSSPSSSIAPPVTRSWPGGRRPSTACAVTDFPDPDSPTRHTISPACTSNDTSSTAWARSASTGSSTVRPRIERTGRVAASVTGTAPGAAGRACPGARRPAG